MSVARAPCAKTSSSPSGIGCQGFQSSVDPGVIAVSTQTSFILERLSRTIVESHWMQSALRRVHQKSPSLQWFGQFAFNYTIWGRARPAGGEPHCHHHFAQSFWRTSICTAKWSSTEAENFHQGIPRSSSSDTIYALSTAPGRAAIAVIRISGSECLQVMLPTCNHRIFSHAPYSGLSKSLSRSTITRCSYRSRPKVV